MAVAIAIIALVVYVGMRHGPKWETPPALKAEIERNRRKRDT